MIRSEGGQLVGVVFVDTSRPIADYVADAKAAVARDVKLGAGLRLGWVGQGALFGIGIVAVDVLGPEGVAPFIYFQF